MSSLVIDYIVFGALICLSIGVALWSKFSGPKEKVKSDYVFAQSRVSMGSMVMSLARGFLGVRAFLGYPSELFYRGSGMWQILYGMVIALPLIGILFVPVYFSLGVTSVYQYLDLRFKSRLVRCLASATYIIRGILYLGTTVFTPCVALKTVIGLPYWVSIVSITTFAISFTVLAGLRSAIMADVVQGLIMIICSCVIILQGTVSAGGPWNVIRTAQDDGRLEFFTSNVDPTVRMTTLSAVIGQLFMQLLIFGCQQNFVQRYCSMSSEKEVFRSLRLTALVMVVLFSMSWIVGMVIYANYSRCDPLKLGYISKIDEILPFYVEDKFYFLPGFLGLVMASLFNGALSFCVSNLNSLAVVCWEDFLAFLPCFRKVSETTQLTMIKIMAIVCGLLVMGTAAVASNMAGVIESNMLMTSATSGPLLGVFLLAMFFPSANWKGAAGGMLAGHILVIWITYGRVMLIQKPAEPLLPTSTEGCGVSPFAQHHQQLCSSISANFTDSLSSSECRRYEANSETPFTRDRDWLAYLFSISYMYYVPIGATVTVIAGLVISYCTNMCSKDDECEDHLVHPLAIRVSEFFSRKKRCYRTSGVNNGKTKSPIIETVSETIKEIRFNGNFHTNT